MKNWAIILVLLLGWANVIFGANESINVDSLNGRVKETYSNVGAPHKPFDFSLVSVTGLPGGGGGGGGVSITAASPIIVTPNPILTTGTISLNATSKANWDAAFTERRQWDGGPTNLDPVLGRTSLGLGTAALFNVEAFQPMTTFRFSIVQSLEGNVVNLAGDLLTPGTSKYYGTDAGGSKGWFTLPTPPTGGVPGGSSGQAQYNNAGAFGGISSMTTADGSTVLQQTGNFYRLTDPTSGGQAKFDLSSIPAATLRTIKSPNVDSVTVVPDAGAANNFLTGITTAGAITKAQPSFTNLSGDFALTQTPSATASRLIGRGSTGPGDWQEIILGTGLTMSGTTLNAGGGGGAAGGTNTQLQYNNAGAFGGVASALYTGSELLLDSSTTVHRDTADVTKRFRFNMTNVPTASTVDVFIPNSTNPVVVAPDIGATNNFLTGITTLGVITKARPVIANLSDATTVGQNFVKLPNPSFLSYPRINADNTVTATVPATVRTDIGALGSSQATFTNTGSAGTPLTWTNGVTLEQESATLTADRYALLPTAISYLPGTIITYVDTLTTGNFGRNFRPANNGTDTLDGSTYTQWNTAGTWLKPFIAGGLSVGQGVYQFKSDGTGNWISIYADGRATKIQDAADATKTITFDVSGQTPGAAFSIIPALLGSSVTIRPDTIDNPGQSVSGAGANGELIFAQTLPDPTSLTDGRVLAVSNPTGSAGVWTDTTIAQAITGWAALDATGAAITWTPVAGQGQQNAYISAMPGNRTLTISTAGLQSGQTFNLIVQQDATGGRLLTFTTPTQIFTPSNGIGLIQQTLTPNAIDYYELKYTGVSTFPFLVTSAILNLTAAALPTCSTTGTSFAVGTASANGNILAASGNKYRAMNFVATETSVCRIDVPLLKVVGTTGPNYALHAAIYTDAIRAAGTYTSGVTTSGSNSVTDATAVWTGTDQGQRITFSAGYPAGTYYIATVVSATSITVSTDKAGATAANATSSQTGVTTATYGLPGTIVDTGTGNTNSINASSLPTTAAAANSAPTSFTGLTATGMTVGTTYHIVLWGDGTASATDYVQWVYDPTTAGNVANGYAFRISSNATTWSLGTAKIRGRYVLYH